MSSRIRERLAVMAGMLTVAIALLLFATGCEQTPTSPHLESAAISSLDLLSTPTLQASTGGLRGEREFNLRELWCYFFPAFCYPRPPQEPWDPCTAWGGKDFHLEAKDVPTHARFHNACLSAWRRAERSPEGLLKAMKAEADALGLQVLQKPDEEEQTLLLFQGLLAGEVQRKMIPTAQTVRDAFKNRPQPGPFASDEPMLSLLESLEDGISKREVKDWQLFAQSLSQSDVREYWAASGMAASVEWWYNFSEEVGEDCSVGVFADLSALQQTQNPQIIAVASLAGLVVDFITHFWPQDE